MSITYENERALIHALENIAAKMERLAIALEKLQKSYDRYGWIVAKNE